MPGLVRTKTMTSARANTAEGKALQVRCCCARSAAETRRSLLASRSARAPLLLPLARRDSRAFPPQEQRRLQLVQHQPAAVSSPAGARQ